MPTKWDVSLIIVVILKTTHVSFGPFICFREKLLVTPYGFDDTVWDPSKDKFLPAKYSVDDTNGKAVCKAALRKQLGFSGNGSSIVVSDAKEGVSHSFISFHV